MRSLVGKWECVRMIGQSLSYTRHTHTELNMFKSQNDKSGFLCHRRDSPACGELRAVGEERRGEEREGAA